MNIEVKTYITIPPEKEELDENQPYPGYIKMTNLDDLDVFNYEFGRSGGYPSGKVVFFVDGEPLLFNSDVSELYTFWYTLLNYPHLAVLRTLLEVGDSYEQCLLVSSCSKQRLHFF